MRLRESNTVTPAFTLPERCMTSNNGLKKRYFDMMKKGSGKRQSEFSVLSLVSTDDDNGLLKVQLYFQGIVFGGFSEPKLQK